MGFLTPLYLAGLAALAAPAILHLIRRAPRGRKDFGSLMFLTPSPPKLTRRSRIDHWLLLLARAVALALLAFAFARPFFRESAAATLASEKGRRVAIALDVSASMRRADLWPQAIAAAEATIADLSPADDVAIYTFSDRLRTALDFEREEGPPPRDKRTVARSAVESLRPTWGDSDLGGALVGIASELLAARERDASGAEQSPPTAPLLVVIGDFQRGSRTDALQSFEWPASLPVEARVVRPAATSNASVQLLVDEEGAEPESPRVRVTNAADSTKNRFFVSWAIEPLSNSDSSAGQDRPTTERGDAELGDDSKPRKDEAELHVPPGESRVVRLPPPVGEIPPWGLRLRGDDADFDNFHYLAHSRPLETTLLYLGSDAATDQRAPRYFLELALADDPRLAARVESSAPDAAGVLTATPGVELVVLPEAITTEVSTELTQFLARGGHVLCLPRDQEATQSLTSLFVDLIVEDDSTATPAADTYFLLGEIDFTHPWFVPFANPRYSDFTKIHFWRRRLVSLKEPFTSSVVARFDDGRIAILERRFGAGAAWLMTSSWRPEDSQWAVSSKFIPLVAAILERATGGPPAAPQLVVGQPYRFPESPQRGVITARKPDGAEIELAAGARSFEDTDLPGPYELTIDGKSTPFAVNLVGAESDTAPLELEKLEQWGVRLGDEATREAERALARQQRDVELESRQGIWRWLIAACLGVLIGETWLAGRASRKLALNAESSI